MKSAILAICCLFFVVQAVNAFSVRDQWELEMDKEGIRVYTQLDEDSPYKQIKVTATINAPMEKVMEILMGFNHYSHWMNDVAESYLINRTDSAYYVFILEDATWPMQNRYQVSKMDIDNEISHSLVRFKSIPNFIEKRTDAIQIKRFEGYWELENMADHRCALEFVLIQDPGGHIPPWMANFHAVENPFQSIANLKRLAESLKVSP